MTVADSIAATSLATSPPAPERRIPMEQLRTTTPSFARATAHAEFLAQCRRYFHEQSGNLIPALERVAGPGGARRATRLSSDLDRAVRWNPRFLDRLRHLRDLLMLEHQHGDWPEIVPDMDVLDPASGLAETCCCQADRIQDLIEAATCLKATGGTTRE